MENEKVKKWIERVEYDLKTAEAMLLTGRYIYAVFMCQQAIEKCLKAYLEYNRKEIFPIHNLRRLAEECGIITEFNKEQIKKLDFLSQYYINARYKEDVEELSKGLSKEVTITFIEFADEIIQWLKTKMKL